MKADNFSTLLPSKGFPFDSMLGIAVTETVLATWLLSKAKKKKKKTTVGIWPRNSDLSAVRRQSESTRLY